jgi:hypothetical protein
MLAVANARSSLGEHEVAEELVRRALALQERAQAGDADMVRSLSVLSKIYLASGKTQLGTELADKAAQRQRRIASVPRIRNTRARLDRDTPDFSVDPGDPPRSHPMQRSPASPPSTQAMTPGGSLAAARAGTPGRAGTPSRPGTPSTPSTPSTPATLGLIRTYAQMIQNAGGASHGKRRSWWSRVLGR